MKAGRVTRFGSSARLRGSVVALSTLAALAACAHEDHHVASPGRAAETRPTASGQPAAPPQYLVADPGPRAEVILVPLGGASGAQGIVVDHSRVVVGRGEPRVATEVTDGAIVGAVRIPGRFGGGFLFWTENSVYRSESFEGALKPVTRTLDGIQSISFGPKFLLVRTHNGERWALSLPSGDRTRIEPLGVSDIEALDDGRALAFTDQGAALSSVDGGTHWTDVTSQVHGSPSRVEVVDGEVWLYESTGGGVRLEVDGSLSTFDKRPIEKAAVVRPSDPRWRSKEAPLRTAFRGGAVIDETTALVIEDGDLVRVDVRTGEIAGLATGKLPPDARCEAINAPSEVVFACQSRTGGTSFVVSHVMAGDAPTIEQSFAVSGMFWASDDGGLAFPGNCGGAGSSAGAAPFDQSVCVRQPSGSWQEYDVTGVSVDAGAPQVQVDRWIPHADGHAVALILEPNPMVFDPRSGMVRMLPATAKETLQQGATRGYRKGKRYFGADTPLVDTSWTFAGAGTLRGWHRQGGTVDITEDGRITHSPYAFEIVSHGPNALGRTREGRLYQSTDHGVSWVEIMPPPSGVSSSDLRSCSAAGCDLGGFYRVGWAPRSPKEAAASAVARTPAELRRTRAMELSCKLAGPVASKVLPRTDRSPEDLGLGSARLATSGDDSENLAYLRTPLARTMLHPLHDLGSDDLGSRAMLSGYQTSRDGDVLRVLGPNKNAKDLRRQLAYVPAFDPAAPIRRAQMAMSEVLSVGRAAGMSTEDVLSDDMTESGTVFVATPSDPAAGGDLVFHNPRGLLAVVKGERTRLGMRTSQSDAVIVSAVALPGDEYAFLELEPTGLAHVFKMNAAGIVDLFDVGGVLDDASFYPGNPDALAVNARGDVAVIRTPSGGDPASELDPALLLAPTSPPVALAPWSELKFADDPACKADPSGWRATIHVVAPWVRINTPELRVAESMMLARVRWSDKRVCLEGIELGLSNVNVRIPQGGGGVDPTNIPSWLVARGNAFTRVAISEGIEWRQPLECTLANRP